MSTTTVLYLAANPQDTDELSLAEEIRAIDGVLRQTQYAQAFDVKSHWAVRVADLAPLLLRHRPEIVHFSGHGSARGEIILQDDNGLSVYVPPYALAALFKAFQSTVRCVVLDACYSEAQALAIAEHIDCVVGISAAITDLAARHFSAGFYGALGAGEFLQTAFDLGCVQIGLAGLGEEDALVLLGQSEAVQFMDVDSEETSPPRDAGINIIGSTVNVSGDLVGRDKNSYSGDDPE